MGLVSFCFIAYTISAERNKSTILTFEVVHILLFIMSIIYIVMVMLAVWLSLVLSEHWKRFERMKVDQFKLHIERYQRFNAIRKRHDNKIWRHFGWHLFRPWRYVQFRESREIVVFNDVRWQFIYFRKLSGDFKFASFLRSVKAVIFIDLADSHPGVWLTLLAFIGMDLLRARVGAWNPANFDAIILISLSALCIVVVSFLSNKLHRISAALSVDAGKFYETMNEAGARDEEQAPNNEQEINRDSLEIDITGPPDVSFQSTPQPIYSTMSYAPERETISAPSLNRRKTERKKTRKISTTQVNSEAEVRNDSGNVIASETSPTRIGELEDSVLENHEEDEIQVDRIVPLESKRSRPPIEGDEITADKTTEQDRNSAKVRRRAGCALPLHRSHDSSALEKNAKDVETANKEKVKYKYPNFLVWIFPRLEREPSEAEKLFWGSSKVLFLRVLEGTLFFTNVNLSATIAKVIFHVQGKKPSGAKAESSTMLFAALGCSIFAWVYVLFRAARIMRSYIFVLTNANLIEEELTLNVIRRVKFKNLLTKTTEEVKDESDSEDDERQENVQIRRELSDYMHTVNPSALHEFGVGASSGDVHVGATSNNGRVV